MLILNDFSLLNLLDIQRMQLKEEIADITAKNAICKLKSNEIGRQISMEKEIDKNIDEITPVKFTLSNAIDKHSNAALTLAKAELKKFYATFNHTENYEGNFCHISLTYIDCCLNLSFFFILRFN